MSTPTTVLQYNNPFSPLEKCVKHFAARGLSQDVIIANKLSLTSWESMVEETNVQIYPKSAADRIPYHDIDGTILQRERGGEAIRYRRHIKEGSMKYVSAREAGSFAYLPQVPSRSDLDWVKIASDVDVPVAFTEGEYKSLKSCMTEGPATIGLGGVWMFRNRNKTGFCTPLNKFNWEGREVYIAFDADEESTPENPFKIGVQKALNQFGAMLENAGAKVLVSYIARTGRHTTGTKMGLDDYLEAGGNWLELGATAEAMTMEPQLARMMARYAVYMGSKPHLMIPGTTTRYTKSEFTELIEANKFCPDPAGGKKPIKVAHVFVNHANRPEFDKYVFRPDLETGLDQDRRVYNQYPGMAAVPSETGCGERVREVYETFMKKMCGEHWEYVVSWWAHLIQKPWEKTTIAMLCKGSVNGSGKSLMGMLHGKLLGNTLYCGSYALGDIVNSDYNDMLENRLLMQCDEAGVFFDGAEGKIKDLISNPYITIKRKFFDSAEFDNFMRLFLTTNAVRPMRLDDQNRRMFVWTPDVTKAEARGEWGEWLREVVVKGLLEDTEAIGELMSYLLAWDLTAWEPTAPVRVTEEMMELVEVSGTKNESVAESMLEEFLAEELKWLFVPGSLSKSDNAVWSEFRELVVANGGQKVRDQYTKDKRKVGGALYELSSKNLRTQKDTLASGSNIVLAPGQIEGADKALSGLTAERVWRMITENVKGSNKY
jgi:hypothetical protein